MTFRTTLLAAAALIGMATAASAAPLATGSSISLNGFVIAGGSATLGSATSLDFTTQFGVASPGAPGTLTSYGTGTGSFAGITCSAATGCGSIRDITSLTTGAQTIANFLSLTGGNNTNAINFSLSSISAIGRSDPNFLTFTANGTISYDGFDATPGVFLFSAQGNTITSFSGTTLSVATPEPASLAILGGSLAALGLIRRRKA